MNFQLQIVQTTLGPGYQQNPISDLSNLIISPKPMQITENIPPFNCVGQLQSDQIPKNLIATAISPYHIITSSLFLQSVDIKTLTFFLNEQQEGIRIVKISREFPTEQSEISVLMLEKSVDSYLGMLQIQNIESYDILVKQNTLISIYLDKNQLLYSNFYFGDYNNDIVYGYGDYLGNCIGCPLIVFRENLGFCVVGVQRALKQDFQQEAVLLVETNFESIIEILQGQDIIRERNEQQVVYTQQAQEFDEENERENFIIKSITTKNRQNDIQIILCSFCNSAENEKFIQRFINPIDTIQYQICQECIQDQIQKEEIALIELEKEVQLQDIKLLDLQEQLKNSKSIAVTENIEQLEEQEKKLELKMEQLRNYEIDEGKKLLELKQKVLQQETQESTYWNEINKYESNLVRLEEKNIQADNDLKVLNEEIDRLHSLNVVNDVFYIHCSEQAATINGLIIGKKQDQSGIDWDETNAGLGQLTVLMAYLQNKYQYKPKYIQYYNCQGNQSSIRIFGNENQKEQILNLYGPVANKNDEIKFNEAMKMILREFNSFTNYLQNSELIKSKEIQIELPHKIFEDTIENLPLDTIQLKEPKWDKWTQVAKFFFANLKYMIERNCLYDSRAELEFINEI